ncbi:SusC/RagA family TonB-linked outer membrane protein [Pedobacter miscanthi]|uniref:SusC/RagA family TonB-linked outer membrane protein n=1 Tax=Pedobacter miscanthi TaxID=2259170 RepID=UPI0029304B00|nr:SusC/RagA family TonB-linked outer membrane protein [Pedobacter miscanthi]
MKLTALLLTAIILQVSATTLAQKVTLKEKNITLDQVFNKISSQTGYDFLYTTSLLKSTKPVTIDVKNAELDAVLKEIFSDQPLEFSIGDKSVVVTPRLKPPLRPVNAGSFTPITITGKVVDSASGKSLSGANVIIKGTNHGGRTTATGSFILPGVEENSIVMISFIGYKPREIPATSNMGIILLSMSSSNLDEVAVSINTGYQRIKPEQSTGAVSQLSTKMYESRISTNFLDGLVNKLPGLMINNSVLFNSTVPGGNASSRPLFNIRGISTMSANQTPLIVVDGYPTELTLDLIDPNEIKSVTILKDAAAATVYGVRASNGVIVIERKTPLAGKAQFTFRATTALTPKENYSRYRWADDASAIAVDYKRSVLASSVNSSTWAGLARGGELGGSTRRTPIYYLLAQAAANIITPAQAASSFAGLAGYDNLEEYSDLFQRNAFTKTYNLNVSGGSPNALYYISSNYTGNRATAINNNDNRFSISARSLLKFTKRLSLDITTDYQEQRMNNAPVPGVTSTESFEHYQDVNGNPTYILGGSISPYYNRSLMAQGLADNLYYPLIDVNEISDKTHIVNNRFKADFIYNIGGGFDLTFGGVYENSRSDFRHSASERSSETINYINSYAVKNPDGTLKYNIPVGGYLNQEGTTTTSYTARTQLNFNRTFANDHFFSVIAGAEVRSLINKGNTSSYFGYNDESLLLQPVDFSAISTGAVTGSFQLGSPLQGQGNFNNFFNQQYNEDRFLSGYSTFTYSFKNTYTLTASARIDQSNLFGTNPKYKYKPLWSVGAGWNIDKESFMDGVDWVNKLKLRASYGFNGNVAKLSLPEVIARSVLSNYVTPTTQALTLLSYANSSLRWEQTKNVNIGLDYTIFKNVRGALEYYTKRSTDLLGNAVIDPTIGVSPTLINQATINNQGLELSLNADWISTPKVNWNTALAISRNTSKVLDVYQASDSRPSTLAALGYVKNYPVGAMFAYNYVGLDNKGYPLVSGNGGKIYDTQTLGDNTPTGIALRSDTSGIVGYAGSSIPTIFAGLTNRVDIGSFYFQATINYYGGFKVRVPRPNPSVNRPLEGAGSYWRVPGDELKTDVMGLAGFFNNQNARDAYNFADKYVVHGDYITLGDLIVSYNFDQSNFIKKIGLNHLELKAQASNLYTVGLNRYNYSLGAGGYEKSYITPTFSLALLTNF